MASVSRIYIMSNKGHHLALKLWEKQAQNFLGIEQSTMVDFILGQETITNPQSAPTALELLTEKLNAGDVLITDGNKASSDDLYPPLLSALETLRNRSLKNIHIILVSANTERVQIFKCCLDENRFNENTDVHVYCCPVDRLRDCLINKVQKRRLLEDQLPISDTAENTDDDIHNLRTAPTFFAEFKANTNACGSENKTASPFSFSTNLIK